MPQEKLLREARMEALKSFGHKALLVLCAYVGFWSLHWLGQQRTGERVVREARWIPSTRVVTVARNVVNQLATPPRLSKGTAEVCEVILDSRPRVRLGSRDQLISEMQDRAEACLWARFRVVTKDANDKIAAIEGQSLNVAEKTQALAYQAERIVKQESYFTTLAKVARHRVGVQLRSFPLAATKLPVPRYATNGDRWQVYLRDKIRRAAPDDSDSHILFEILWYAALLVGVLSVSILFVVVLTALPITNAEGLWTKRIHDILERIPVSAKPMIAIPLLAAAIGGGTLGGAIAATQPGGEKRVDNRVSASSKSHIESNAAYDQRVYQDNGITTIREGDNIGHRSTPIDLQPVVEALAKIANHLGEQVEQTKESNREINRTFIGIRERVERVEIGQNGSDSNVAEIKEDVEEIRSSAKQGLVAAQALSDSVAQLGTSMVENQKNLQAATSALQEVLDRKLELPSMVASQAAAVDERGVWARTFGKTLYLVGPMVPHQMKAWIAQTTYSDLADRVFKGLEALRGKEPVDFSEYRSALIKELTENQKVPAERAENLLREHEAYLRKISALSRY